MTKRALMNTNVDELLPVSGKESTFVGLAVGAATVVVGTAVVVVVVVGAATVVVGTAVVVVVVVGAVAVVVGSETVVAGATGVPAIAFEAGESPIAFTLLIVTE
jgi:hypothetical protein